MTFASFFCDLRNFAAEGAENQGGKLVGGLCGRAIASGVSRANPRRLSLPEAGIPTTGNLFPYSVEHPCTDLPVHKVGFPKKWIGKCLEGG